MGQLFVKGDHLRRNGNLNEARHKIILSIREANVIFIQVLKKHLRRIGNLNETCNEHYFIDKGSE